MREYAKIAVRAAVVASVGSVIIYLIADALGASMLASQPGGDGTEDVPLALVVVQSLLFPLVGATVAWFIARRMSNGGKIYTWLAIAVFIGLSISALANGDGASTVIALLSMHVAVLVPTLLWVVPALPSPGLEKSAG